MREFKKRANGSGCAAYLGKRKKKTLGCENNNWKRY